MVRTGTIRYYELICDKCGKSHVVQEDIIGKIYNAAQAARSIGWSYGRDKATLCDNCRTPYNKRGLNI